MREHDQSPEAAGPESVELSDVDADLLGPCDQPLVDQLPEGWVIAYNDVTDAPDLDERGPRHLPETETGRLLGAAVSTVLSLTGESGPVATALRRFATEVGTLFQIVDDIRGCDVRRRKRTYASVFGLEPARKLARDSHAIACSALAEAPADTSALEHIADYILRTSEVAPSSRV